MWNNLWTCKSRYAKWWLVGAVAVYIVLYGIAWVNPAGGLFGPFGQWTNREFIVLVAMFLLLLAAWLMHKFDERCHGLGFQNIYSDNAGSHERSEQMFVPAVLTVESIRTAMIAGILAILLNDRKDYLPHSSSDPRWHSLSEVVQKPDAVFFLVVVGALASSLVTTMAALLCYEYATRFRFESGGGWPKRKLLEKAFLFGNFGFYCLMWSLAVVPVLLDYHMAFISILFVFMVMWAYYFFPARAQEDTSPTGAPSEISAAAGVSVPPNPAVRP